MPTQKLYIKRKKGETLPQKRIRISQAIVNKLRDDEMLRREVAHQLGINPDLLDIDIGTTSPDGEHEEI